MSPDRFVAIWIAGLATLTERRYDGYALIAADRRHGWLIETGGRVRG